jgi:hypothetical protein
MKTQSTVRSDAVPADESLQQGGRWVKSTLQYKLVVICLLCIIIGLLPRVVSSTIHDVLKGIPNFAGPNFEASFAFWDELLKAIGDAFTVTGMVGLLSEIAFKSENTEMTLTQLKETINDHGWTDNLARVLQVDLHAVVADAINGSEEIRKGSVVNITDGFLFQKFDEEIGVGQNISILQTWLPEIAKVRDPIISSVNTKHEVKILLLAPRGTVAKIRSREMGREDEFVPGNIEENLRYFAKEVVPYLLYKELFKVRLYDTMPSACLYQIGEEWWVAFFLYRMGAHVTPHLICRHPGGPSDRPASNNLLKFLQNHFQSLWNASEKCEIGDWGDWADPKTPAAVQHSDQRRR